MSPVGFEPTISAGERPRIYALIHAAPRTGSVWSVLNINDVSGLNDSFICRNNRNCNRYDSINITGFESDPLPTSIRWLRKYQIKYEEINLLAIANGEDYYIPMNSDLSKRYKIKGRLGWGNKTWLNVIECGHLKISKDVRKNFGIDVRERYPTDVKWVFLIYFWHSYIRA